MALRSGCGWGAKAIFGCGGDQNYTGYCQRLVTADLDQAERILDADQQARVLNRADAQLARDVPVIPLYQIRPNRSPYDPRCGTSAPTRVQPALECGELVARALARAAIAVSLLAVSGAGGAGAQTPKRGGIVVIGTTTAFEPPCLNLLGDRCGTPPFDLTIDVSHVLAGAFEVTPDGTCRRDLVSHARIVSTEPLHARVPHPSRGTLERRRPRHGTGLRLHAPGNPAVCADSRRERACSQRPSARRKTVQVVLRERWADWRYLFPIVFPKHALAGADLANVWQNRIDNPKTGAAIGSGPFLVGGWQRGRQLTFVRNPHYWGPQTAYLDGLAYRFLPPGETSDALRRGDIDMIQPGPAVLEAQHRELRVRPEPGISVRFGVFSSFEHFLIRVGDGGHPQLKRRAVRQALAYGIDRVAIARAIGELSFAHGATIGPQDSFVFLRSSRYYRPNWSSFRLRAAVVRRLLEQEAGCRKGTDAIYVCDGDRLSFRFATPAGIERRELTIRLAQEQLRQVGIEVKLEFARPAVFFGSILPSGNFDVASFAWIQDASTSGPGTTLTCQGDQNLTGYCDRLLTRDLLRAERTLDLSRRVELLHNIDARLAKIVVDIPLYQAGGLFAFDRTVRGLQLGATGSFTWNAEDWWLER